MVKENNGKISWKKFDENRDSENGSKQNLIWSTIKLMKDRVRKEE